MQLLQIRRTVSVEFELIVYLNTKFLTYNHYKMVIPVRW